jgi:hypothetical protein
MVRNGAGRGYVRPEQTRNAYNLLAVFPGHSVRAVSILSPMRADKLLAALWGRCWVQRLEAGPPDQPS